MPKEITIIGAGRMGLAIAQVMATAGCSVNLVSRNASTLYKSMEEIESNLKFLWNLERLDTPVKTIIGRITPEKGISEHIFDCEFLFEAIPEDPELKKKLFSELNPHLKEKTIIASTTSTINLSTFKGIFAKPDRFLITHWLNPAFIMPLVEIAVGEETSKDTAEQMKAFLKEIGKIPVVLKDSPGFILARFQTGIYNEAARILEEGIASAEDIDTVSKIGLGFRLMGFGALEFVDLGGLDILYYTGQFLYSVLRKDQFKTPDLVMEKMKKNEIGPRTGKGIYDFSETDTRKLFESRYHGFLELLDFINTSKTLSFEGGIKIRDRDTNHEI